ncbi:nonribosomal peptide synthetase fmqA [Aspergillus clavatus NRRL 1]|uniref:Nonribosomal peptide synthase, putative n=1 Tax=Aspergillus clavatus (strain ATCC 1007 / CBS 513.65 / DSM 816 / NCTC 3887 / NRRL 1 / QM 1276 / 107) TaxID=344612 RepID=A1CN65_ASPCL|nr:nonribosomal peptide synthase, putative [Aspergillus clavatus NRRL 1]EAW07086.1 nonribosomal peptide synthase, putative [Aspergillus clavatus NRRL 1]
MAINQHEDGSFPPAEKCLFPIRNDGNLSADTVTKLWGVTNLCSCALQQAGIFDSSSCSSCLNSIPTSKQRDPIFFLATIWALLLWEYAEVETAHVGVQEISSSADDTGSKKHMRLLGAPRSPNLTLAQLSRGKGWSVSKGNRNHFPYFNTGIVVYRNSSRPDTPESDCLTTANDDETCDIILVVDPTQSEWYLKYKTAVVSSGQAEHLASFLVEAARTLMTVEDSGSTVSPVELSVTVPTHQSLIRKWNRAAPVQLSAATIHQIIRNVAMTDPGHPALIASDGELTYGQLDSLSSRLARYLQTKGVRPGMLIPVCFNKSLWAIVAMLAINKAGAAFVTLDASQPPSRLRSIIKQLDNPPLALASPENQTLLADMITPTLAVADSILSDLPMKTAKQNADDWPVDATAPAYCFFTSGSTGEPKGCLVDHAALASVATHCHALHLDSTSRVLQFASFSFGVSLIEIWCTLSAGGTICMPSDSDRVSRLGDAVQTMGINWAFVTPTVLATLHPDMVPGLRRILVAGEALKKAQISVWASRTSLFQAFGFTEWAGVCCVSPQIHTIADIGIIGTPANARCWLIKPGEPETLAPIGAVGEILVEGPSLAQGYLHSPEKSAASFLQAPAWRTEGILATVDGKRKTQDRVRGWYKTGDLAFYDSNGLLRYVSRKDRQVKVRGQRIDLGEPEFHIAQASPLLRKAVIDAIVPADGDGVATLMAFVPALQAPESSMNGAVAHGDSFFTEPNAEFVATVHKVIEYLEERLPDVMIPRIFLQIRSMPLTVTGKIDRLRLRQEAQSLRHEELLQWTGTAKSSAVTNAPQSTHEYLIHGLVVDVLRLNGDQVGMEHDFFALGGDSVKAMKLVSRARAAGIELTVKHVFGSSQLSELAIIAAKLDQAPSVQLHQLEPFALIDGYSKSVLISAAKEQCRVEEDQIEDIYPCTPLQEGMMALSAAKPGAYIARFVHLLQPHVNHARVRQAWEAVVQACPILRTRIVSAPDGGMFQVVLHESFQWDEFDESAGASKETYMEKRQTEPLLLGDPLLHAALLPGSSPDSHTGTDSSTYLIITMHHSVCDRWASRLLMDLFEKAYDGHVLAHSPMTPFMHYMQQRLANSSTPEFWKQKFQGLGAEVFPALPSPGYTPMPRDSCQRSIVYHEDAPSGYTISNVLRLAWALVISHYTSSPDVVFGVTVSGRAAPVANIEQMIAPIVATLPLRVRFNPTDTVLAALSAVQKQSTEMIPFEQFGLQRIRKLSSDAADGCSYQSQLVVQPVWADEQRPLLTTLEAGAAVAGGFASCALSVVCSLTASRQVDVAMEFDPLVVPKAGVERILRHFEQVVQVLLAEPQCSLASVPLLSAADVTQLQQWSGNLSTVDSQCVHSIIKQRCVEYPTSTAVWAWDGKLTYRELDQLSDRLAAELATSHGIRPEVIVPICMERSRWTTVAILGVIKAGGAFVLLDASQPQTRLENICQRVNAAVVLTSEGNIKLAQQLAPAALVIDEPHSQSWPSDVIIPSIPGKPTSTLYVAFTSGSTGTPKGVVIEHQSFCASALALNDITQVTPHSRLLQFAGYSFDGSIMETLSALMAGACLCVPSDFQRRNELASATKEFCLTHAHLTPSLARHVLRDNPDFTKVLVSVGEPLTPSDVADWATSNPQCRVMNGYGPAECAVSTTIQPLITTESSPQNIGFALTGIGCWVVHPENHDILLPIGAVGELLVEGPTVARGYLNDPTQSAAVFISSPPSWMRTIRPHGASGRMYKTGDLVRYNTDGSLQYVGRRDSQVKLRGQRIELGEVEKHVRQCWPGLTGVAVEMVTFTTPSASTQNLIGFVVADAFDETSSAPLDLGGDLLLETPPPSFHEQAAAAHGRLCDSMPRFMVPEVFLPVRALPQSAAGKLDRRRLRDLARTCSPEQLALYRSDVATQKRAPTSESERAMQAVWSHVLNHPLEEIGVDDNFYHLGGDSITAMQIVAQARAKGLAVSLDEIMRHKTISQIVLNIAAAPMMRHQAQEDELDVEFPLSPIQQMFMDHQAQSGGWNRFNQTFLLRLAQPISLEQLCQATSTLLARHSMLRARFTRSSDSPWTQSIRRLPAAHEQQDYWPCTVHDVRTRGHMNKITTATSKSINIEAGPLAAANLLNVLEDGSQHLFLVVHHLVVDLVSWRIILADLESILKGETLPRTNDSISFQAWSRMQSHHAEHMLTPKASLPVDLPQTYHEDPRAFWFASPGQPNRIVDTQLRTFTLNKKTTRVLLGAANHTFDTQPVEILHAALLHSFRRAFPDRATPVSFSESHGREVWDPAIDLAQTVGWFTVAWPVVVPGLEQAAQDDLLDAIRRVKDVRRAVPSKGWAYFASRYLNPDGRKAFQLEHPMELIFNYAGEFQQLEHADALFIAESHEAQGALDAGEDIQRFGIFEVFASVQRGRLQFQFMYPREVQHQDMINTWIATCQQTLEVAGSHLVAASQASDHISHTLADFPLMSSLTYPQLKELVQVTLPSLGISMDNVEDIYPCSPSQRGMLIAQAKKVDNYNASVTWKVQSRKDATAEKLNFQRLYDACYRVVQRHAALRTVFVDSASPESYMDQVVLRHVRPDSVIKHSLMSASDPLPLGKSGGWPKGELMHQIHICRVENGRDEELLLRLDMSHTIMDRTTMQIIERDICLAYEGKLSNGRGPLYSDYVAYIDRQDHEAATRYWQEYLEGIEPCEFPSINPDVSDKNTEEEWGHVSRTLKESTLGESSVDSFCRQHNVTIWNLAGLAWALVLRSYTNSDNICFGYVKSGRDLPIDGIADAVGAILNPLTCRISFDKNATVQETIHQLQEEYLQSLRHQSFSLSDAHRLAGITSGALFNTSVGVQTGQIAADGETALDFQTLAMEDGAEDDLVIGVTPNSDHLVLNLRYKTSVLSDSQASSVIATFEKAIRSIITTSGDAPVTAVDIFSEHDHDLIWARNQVVPPLVEACVHDIIHQRCLEHPDSEAACDTEGSLSYRELDEFSTRLARYLTSECGGIAPNEVVPICLEKSRWTPVAMVGVLKAGGTLLLLDTSYPQQRRKEICDEVHARIVVTSATHAAESRELASRVVLLGTDDLAWAEQSQQSTEVSLPKVQPDHSLYVVFTSGSTGKPKGLVVGHGSYCSDARDHIAAWQLTRRSRVTQFSSYAFDMSILEQLSVLMVGACICVVTDEQRKNNFSEVALALKANFAMLVPSVALLFRPEDLPTIDSLMLAGECMTETDVSSWAPHVRLINGYGPAECSALSVVQSSISPTSDPRNVGYPIGCVLWVVDPQDLNCLVPHGAIGELLIEGPIVGKGYINQPEKTAQAFIKPPSWLQALRPQQQTAGRLYMSGDLVRSNPDGSLTVIGRKDRQVKLRGQRLELAEVEVHVLRCFEGAARDAVAEMIAPGGTTKSQLVALVLQPENQVQDEEQQSSASANNTFADPSEEFASQVAAAEVRLRQQVPEFMVPAIFLPLRQMPRTHSGKVDRIRLRNLVASMPLEQLQGYRAASASSASAGASNRDPPSTPAECKLAEIWSQVLDLPLDTISANDNFFLRGGHSIDAMKAAALGRAAGMSFTVADIFAHPILTDLAREAVPKLVNGDSHGSKGTELSRPFSLTSPDDGKSLHAQMCAQGRIPKNSTLEDFLPATQAQFFFIERKTYHSYNWTIKGGSVSMDRLRAACQALLDRYSILRTSFVEYEGRPMQMVLGNVDAEIREYHCADGQEPLDLCRAQWECTELPELNVMAGSLPVKFSLISAPQQVVLTIQISHAQWDGVSIPRLFGDFAALYNQTALPPTSDFSQYVYHRTAPTQEAKDQDPAFKFWREYLEGAEMATPFPAPPPTLCAEQSHQTLWTFKGISPPPSLPAGVTMATLVKSASAFFLAHHLRARDVIFGHTVNGRNLPMDNIESLLGCCLNFIPLRITFPESFDEWTVLDLMNHAQHQYIRALAHEHVELRDIFQHSTSWPAETPLSFIVQHQNIDLSYRLPLRGPVNDRVGKADANAEGDDDLLDVRFSRLAVFDPLDEVWVFTEPHPDRLEVQVCANSRVLAQEEATVLSNGICSIIEQFAADPNMKLAQIKF